MKKWIIKFWYLLPILMIVFLLMLWALLFKEPTVWENVVGILLLLTMISLPVSWVVLLIDHKWGKALISFLATVVIGCVLGVPLCMFAAYAPDGFGKAHPIPTGLVYELPLAEDSCLTEPIDSLDINAYLILRGDYGVYFYDFYYGPLPAGEIYLKCYEVTENIPLSESSIEESSKVMIESTTSFAKLVDKQRFSIFEGDYDDYYAARIEVWYKNAATKEEKKLVEKVYRVEGWMR